MAVAFLHPLTDDTVGTSFDVLVAYDFQAFAAGIVRVTCTLSGQAGTPAYYDVDRSTHPTGELTFAFSGLAAPQDYSLQVTTDPATNGSDSEDPIHVTGGDMVPIQIGTITAQNPVRDEKKGGDKAATVTTSYRLTGRCREADGPVKVKVRSVKANGTGGVIAGPEDATVTGNDWRILIDVPVDDREYLSFEAKLRGDKTNKGRKR
jgi:hypothetical protein